jgi:HTH-type transcriptional regulator / antitoxin HigA
MQVMTGGNCEESVMDTAKYFKLIKRFPLRPIRSDVELEAAGAMLTELGMKGDDSRTQEENDYMEVLGNIIMDYESKSPRIQAFLAEARSIPPQQILRSILEENGISQTQLAREIGVHQENISAFLKGKRGLSKGTAIKLAKRFSVSTDLFMPKLNERMAG